MIYTLLLTNFNVRRYFYIVYYDDCVVSENDFIFSSDTVLSG